MNRSFFRQIAPLLISLVVMGGLSLMLRKFERDTPRPFNRLLIEALPEIPEMIDRPSEFFARLELVHGRLTDKATQRDALVELAQLYHANGLANQAESCYLGLESFETKNPLWPYLLGVLKADRQDKDEIARHFERATLLDPGDSMAYLRLGDTYREAGRYDESAKAYERRLLEAPDDAWALASLGRVALLGGDNGLALEYLLSAKAANPNVGLVYELLAEVYLNLGDVSKSREARLEGAERELSIEPPDACLGFLREYCFNAERLVRYAREARERGELLEAVSCLERAVALELDDDEALAELQEIVAELDKAQLK